MKTRYLFGLPFVTLVVNSREIEVVLDTGFNGSLLLPKNIVEKLNLPRMGFAEYAMADGSFSEAEMYIIEIDWFTQRKKVSVVAVETDLALLGMELLQNIKTILSPSQNVLILENAEKENG